MTSGNGTALPPSIDPRASARGPGTPIFPQRFYKNVDVGTGPGGFALRLDGRGARTPARNALLLPTRGLAEAVAAEWAAVTGAIDPRQMPLTRLVNSVIDGVQASQAAVQAEIERYAASDLVVYRAAEPERLTRVQAAAWDPLVAWSDTLGAPMTLAAGVVFVAQPEASLRRLSALIAEDVGHGDRAPFRLGALHVMTTLTGSVLIALAIARGRLSVEQGWAAAHVDEDFQIAEWGEDAEAAERRRSREGEMKAAAHIYELVS